jgi:multiple sugar transport system substrate-binding protein
MVDDTGRDFPGTDDWEALTRYSSQEASSGGELSRIGFDPKLPEYFPMWVHANGGALVDEEGAPQLDSPEAVEALEATVAMLETSAPWSRFKAFRDTWDFFGDRNQFESDQVAAFPMEDWYVDVLAEASPDVEFETMPFETREGDPITYATGNGWALPKGGADPENACRFIEVMTDAETWVAAAEASKADREKDGQAYTGTFTANSAADEQIFSEVFEPTGQAGLDQAVETIRDVQEVAVSAPASPASAEIQKAYEDAILRVLEGEQSAQEALSRAQADAEEALERAE